MAGLLRIMTYNVRYFGHGLMGLASRRACLRGIAEGLAGLHPAPDVVCLQEVEAASLRSRAARGGRRVDETQLGAFLREVEVAFARIGRRSPYSGLYYAADATRIRGLSIATSGLAILVASRLRVKAHDADAPWQITHRRAGRIPDRRPTRICAHVAVEDGAGRRLHVFNTHLSLPAPLARARWWQLPARLGEAPNQIHEARAVARRVRRMAQGEPFVVCGDFNSTPGSRVFRYLTEHGGFRHAETELRSHSGIGPGGTPTFGKMGVRLQLDHLFCGGGARWIDLEGTRGFGDPRSALAGLSDHTPVVARVHLPPP